MGDCKDNMKPTSDKGKGIFGMIAGRKKKSSTPEKAADTFADTLVRAEEKLTLLIIQKENDLKHETGKQQENQKSLALLKTMDFHLQSILDLAEEYSSQ